MPSEIMTDIMTKARQAQKTYEAMASQELFDSAAQAVAWALMEPSRNQELSELAVRSTGLGNVKDKITKNHRKTLGLLRDIHGKISYGVSNHSDETGITDILRPKGVVAAIVPSTNPVATPTNNIINALKCGNAIVLAPSPKGAEPLEKLLGYIHIELQKIGLPVELVQMIPNPPSKEKTKELMEAVDLLVVTGSQANVRAAYSSGTPAIGVGMGNVTTIIDETADIELAAMKIMSSKTFDNATSCSSESVIIAVDAIYDELLKAFAKIGGLLLPPAQKQKLVNLHWQGGKLNRDTLAQDAKVLMEMLSLPKDSTVKFLLAEETGVGTDYPMSGEKMAVFAGLYRVNDFTEAKQLAEQMLNYQGAGHSLGLHTSKDERAIELGIQASSCRIIVNQAHCFATGGSFDNGLPFSLSMGCGSWGGNTIDGNLQWSDFVNTVRVARVIPANEPTPEAMLGQYWEKYGK